MVSPVNGEAPHNQRWRVIPIAHRSTTRASYVSSHLEHSSGEEGWRASGPLCVAVALAKAASAKIGDLEDTVLAD